MKKFTSNSEALFIQFSINRLVNILKKIEMVIMSISLEFENVKNKTKKKYIFN